MSIAEREQFFFLRTNCRLVQLLAHLWFQVIHVKRTHNFRNFFRRPLSWPHRIDLQIAACLVIIIYCCILIICFMFRHCLAIDKWVFVEICPRFCLYVVWLVYAVPICLLLLSKPRFRFCSLNLIFSFFSNRFTFSNAEIFPLPSSYHQKTKITCNA